MLWSCSTTHFIFHQKILPAMRKDVMPTTSQNMVVYQYVCRCDCRYVGRTTLRLQNRIIRNQRLPTKILPKCTCKATKNPSIFQKSDSAIRIQLLQNKDCANNYCDQQFSILTEAKTSFHLAVLEAIFIKVSNLNYVAEKNLSICYKFRNSQSRVTFYQLALLTNQRPATSTSPNAINTTNLVSLLF